MTRPPEQTKFNALRAKWDHNQRRDSNAPPLASMHALGDTKSEGHGDTERHSPHDNRKRTPSRLHRFGSFSLFSGALNSLKPKLLSRSHKPESKPSSTSASTTAQSDSSKTTTASLRSSPQSTPLTMPSAPAPAPAAASITVYSARTPYESMGPPPPKLPRNNSTSFLPVPVKSASTTSLIPPPSVRTFPQSKSTNLLPRLKSSTIAPPPPPEEARLVRPLRVSLPPQSGASLQASLNQAPRQSSRHPSRQPSLQPQQTPRKPSQRSLQPSFRQSSQRFGQQTPRHHSQRLAQQPPREPSQGVGQQLPRQSSQQFPQQPLEPPSQQFPRQLPLQQSQQQFKRTSKPLPQQRAPNRSRIPTPVGTARAYASALKQDDPNAPPMPRPLPTIPRSKTEPNLISATSPAIRLHLRRCCTE
ncbi:hypothetical protein EJ06DRAFT_99966 [Trichodelitschia bisporula]|uniref:Uncharacterized protein n=1 Tax=Trichodelitschia bisporula TaxID=703511 RepID=A0A6G1HR18_9PEZI|nr:hypothetical protein EJ06DRAFT_99966 [Trichodelitschia bisporula]